MKLRNLIIGVLFFTYGVTNAQDISIHASMAPKSYKIMKNGVDTSSYGISFGGSYTDKITTVFGVSVGLEYNIMSAKITNDKFSFIENSFDIEGDAFRFYASGDVLTEELLVQSIVIPVMFNFDTANEFKPSGLYGGFGIKLMLPIDVDNKITASGLKTKGFYEASLNKVDNIKSQGFGEWGNFSASNSSFSSKLLLSAELGSSFDNLIGKGLHIGVYADYGLVDFSNEEKSLSLVKYNPSGAPNTAASFTTLKDTKSFIFNIGLQLKVKL